jgi:hypothetical protein
LVLLAGGAKKVALHGVKLDDTPAPHVVKLVKSSAK